MGGRVVGTGPILGFPFKEACLLGAGRVWGQLGPSSPGR